MTSMLEQLNFFMYTITCMLSAAPDSLDPNYFHTQHRREAGGQDLA